VVAVIITFIPFLRFYLLRGKRRSAIGLAADVFFGTAWLLTTGMHWTDVWISVQLTRPLSSPEAAYDLGTRYLKWMLSELVLYIPILWSIKAAFLCFYWDIGGGIPSRKLRYLLHGTAILLLATLFILVIVMLTYCKPLSRTWDIYSIYTGTAGFCSPAYGILPQTLWIIFTVSTDICILIIPLLIVRSLDLSRLEKKILPAVFFIGLLTIITPLVRYFVSLRQGLLSRHPVLDKSLPGQLALVYGWIESLAAFMAFSMPAFRFFLTKAFRSKLQTKAWFSATRSQISGLFSKEQPQIYSEPELVLQSTRRSGELPPVHVTNDLEKQIVL